MRKLTLLAVCGLLAIAVLAQSPQPSNDPNIAFTPIVSASLESNHVLKTTNANLYSVYATTGSTAGFLMVFDASSAPADGAVTPKECVVAPANSTTSINFTSAQPEAYTIGIVAVFSSTGCFTKTASATAFFHASVK